MTNNVNTANNTRRPDLPVTSAAQLAGLSCPAQAEKIAKDLGAVIEREAV